MFFALLTFFEKRNIVLILQHYFLSVLKGHIDIYRSGWLSEEATQNNHYVPVSYYFYKYNYQSVRKPSHLCKKKQNGQI